MTPRSALVIGAGIGGITAAAHLRKGRVRCHGPREERAGRAAAAVASCATAIVSIRGPRFSHAAGVRSGVSGARSIAPRRWTCDASIRRIASSSTMAPTWP